MVKDKIKILEDAIQVLQSEELKDMYCNWKQEEDTSNFKTECGHCFYFDENFDGDTSWVKFCPYCGKKINFIQ